MAISPENLGWKIRGELMNARDKGDEPTHYFTVFSALSSDEIKVARKVTDQSEGRYAVLAFMRLMDEGGLCSEIRHRNQMHGYFELADDPPSRWYPPA